MELGSTNVRVGSTIFGARAAKSNNDGNSAVKSDQNAAQNLDLCQAPFPSEQPPADVHHRDDPVASQSIVSDSLQALSL